MSTADRMCQMQEHKLSECSIHELLGWMRYEYDPRMHWHETEIGGCRSLLWCDYLRANFHNICLLSFSAIDFQGEEKQIVVLARDPLPVRCFCHEHSFTSQCVGGFQNFTSLRLGVELWHLNSNWHEMNRAKDLKFIVSFHKIPNDCRNIENVEEFPRWYDFAHGGWSGYILAMGSSVLA